MTSISTLRALLVESILPILVASHITASNTTTGFAALFASLVALAIHFEASRTLAIAFSWQLHGVQVVSITLNRS